MRLFSKRVSEKIVERGVEIHTIFFDDGGEDIDRYGNRH